jgi:hypothetical protein
LTGGKIVPSDPGKGDGEMDKRQAREIGEAALEEMRKVADRYGMTVEYRGGSFTSSGAFSPKFEFKTRDADRLEFQRVAWQLGLRPEDFGRTFQSEGRTFRVTGVNLRASRLPVLAVEVSTGKTYKFPEAAVRTRLVG